MMQAAQETGFLGSGNAGTVLMIVGMIVAVAIVSGLGFIARMNDRSAERKAARREGTAVAGEPESGRRA